jgi:hypothetical protein
MIGRDLFNMSQSLQYNTRIQNDGFLICIHFKRYGPLYESRYITPLLRFPPLKRLMLIDTR